MPKRVVLFSLVLLLAAVPAAHAEELSLEKAIALALLQNQSLKQANYQAEASDWSFARSFSAWLPQVTYDENWSRMDQTSYNFAKEESVLSNKFLPGSTPPVYRDSYAKSINIAQPIFNGLGEWVTIDSAYIARSGAHLTGEDARLQLVLSVKEAYYNVLKTRALAGVARESLGLTRESLRLYRSRLEVGMATPSDVLRWEAQEADADGALTLADNNFALAKMQMATLLGGAVEAEYTYPHIDLEITDADMGRVAEATLAGVKTPLPIKAHPAVKAAETQNDLVKQQLVGSVGRLLPRINFLYSYNWWANNDAFQLGAKTDYAMGIGISIPLFQSGGAVSGIGQSVELQKATA